MARVPLRVRQPLMIHHRQIRSWKMQGKKITRREKLVNYMKETMRADIDVRFAGIELDNNYTVVTYLDPRYKGKFFSSAHIPEQVQGSVARLCDELARVGQTEEENLEKRVVPAFP